MAQLDRTIPPTRNTTGTTTVAYGGLSPIDAYETLIDRPLVYVDSTTAATTSITAITNAYFKQTVVAGMSHALGGSAGHFQTHVSGAATGNILGLASWVELETGMTGYAGGVDTSAVIAPLSVGVRCRTGTVTLTNSMVVFGLKAQFIQSGTGTPTTLYFARINTSSAISALFYTENSQSAGVVAAATHTTEVGQIPLIRVHGAGPTLDQDLFIKLYRD